jgi:hypothetical protein
MARSTLVADAVAVLREAARAAAAPKQVTEAARDIEGAWRRAPWTLGVMGNDLAARTALFDALAGGGLLAARTPGCASLRLRHAARTTFVALREDGPPEELSMLTLLAAGARQPRQLSQEHHAQPRRRVWVVRMFAWLFSLIAAGVRRRALPPVAQPDAFVARLRSLASGAEAGVVEIALHVATSPLPRNVEVVELGDR